MAGSRKESNAAAIDALEDGFHLVRTASLEDWLVYLSGAVPFLLALAFYGLLLTDRIAVSATVAEGACIVALCFLWMVWRRARFASRLRHILIGRPAPSWAWKQSLWIACTQGFLQAVKLIVWPLALLAILPFSWTVAVFRNATALCDAAPEDFQETIRRARRQASLWPAQGWLALAILLSLFLVLLANIAVTFLLLPQFYRLFTGYENEFTRSAAGMISWHLFALSAGVAWLCFDPLVQAVYVARCFRGESLQTGEDLLAKLGLIASRAALVLILLCSVSRLWPQQRMEEKHLDEQSLHRSIQTVLNNPRYEWAKPQSPAPERFLAPLQSIARELDQFRRETGRRLDAFAKWIRDLFPKDQASGSDSRRGSPGIGLGMTIWALLAVFAGLLVLLALHFWRSFQSAPLMGNEKEPAKAIDLNRPDLNASELPEDAWRTLARQCLDRNDFRLALRALYLANLASLGRRNLLSVSAYKSNREYERQLRRRARSSDLCDLFALNLAAFERAWYGMYEVTMPQVEHFEQNLRAMDTYANG